MATRIRSLNFLPEIFQTPTNSQFFAATLDQIVQQPEMKKVEGYIGSRFGYGINAKDYYVTEPNKTRTDYQLDPGVVFTKTNESTAKDFISYPGILDALKMQGGITADNNKLFHSEFYSWDNFTNLDKIINFSQYYWIPQGPESVIVSNEVIFNANEFRVTDLTTGYNIVPSFSEVDVNQINPPLALLRGGTYTFLVNQNSQFWIQGEPGVTGFSQTQPNLQTRDVFGVTNNGISQGVITFTVPEKGAQDQYNLPGNVSVDVISNKTFSQVNNQLVSSLNIDGVTSLDGLTVMFYGTNDPYEVGFVSNYFDLGNYNSVTVTNTTSGTNVLTCTNTQFLNENDPVIFTGTAFGGVSGYSAIQPNVIYFVKSVVSPTQFTVSLTPGGATFPLTTASGTMVAVSNNGIYELGYNTNVSENFYRITYVLNPNGQQVTRLVPVSEIPVDEKITATYGTQYISRNFFRNSNGFVELIPYISAPLDTLYYQDGTIANKVGTIKIFDNNFTNALDVESEILGKKTYTATNGVTFTNGLKITFQGDVVPRSYLGGEYYVEGVGSAIELIPVENFETPETFTSTLYDPFDVFGFDSVAYEGDANVPLTPDYITIARNSLDKNAWSRSNRWFHIDVINATANYNNNQNLITEYTSNEYKAKRPIIEFYPNLKLFDSGTEGKTPVDFIDTRTTDAFSLVAGKETYYPDIEVYTDYNGTIATTDYVKNRVVASASDVTGIWTLDGGYNTTGFNVNDLIIFNDLPNPSTNGFANNVPYYIIEVVSSNQFKLSNSKNGSLLKPTVAISTNYTFTWNPQSTTVTIPANKVTVGSFVVGQYIADSNNILPVNTQITNITGTTTLTLTVEWDIVDVYFTAQTNVALVASDINVDNYGLFDGAKIVFANDSDTNVRNKIYQCKFSQTVDSSDLVITLTEIQLGDVLPNNQTVCKRGYYNGGKEFYFDGIDWIQGQQKLDVNQPPLFDVFDENDISFGNKDVYVGTSFTGNKLFSYGIGEGIDDSILGFPLKYSSVDNLGDISFDVNLNTDSFNYVVGGTPITQKVNTGYVFSYKDRVVYTRQLGWQTAIAPSVQYQAFDFSYDPLTSTNQFECDVSAILNSPGEVNWPTIFVFVNNNILTSNEYSVTVGPNSTIVTLTNPPVTETVIQVLLLSNQVSKTAYYTIPWNLNNNPLNADILEASVGDIRGQYQSMFYNNPNTTGQVFGSNNFRDLGNMVPYGTKIIQNSASLVLPGAFLRSPDHNLFNSLIFNSREYVKFKNLLVYTVQNTDYSQRFNPSTILDDALDQITATKTNEQPFFWSDMLPGKAAYKTNVYNFANSIDTSIFPLDRIYDFTKANYYGVLVYLTRTTNNISYTQQLIKGTDYIVSSDAPSLTVTLDLVQGDIITIKEYNQTYGSYVPNTPTKLGLYPVTQPSVVLDSNYNTPTYFIKGHDGSYNKLYGDYDPNTGFLIDFRDQALLEFELRIFNNLKLSSNPPIALPDIIPGFFRETAFSYDEWLLMYSTTFLDWIGQNRLDYKTQAFNKNDSFTYNYYQSGNQINGKPISQGYWRGIYQYFYDTTTPDSTPWEMLGFANQPSWWETRYGPAPYTRDNFVLWEDLSNGYIWNNGNPYIDTAYARPELLSIIPVNSAGELLSPLDAIVGNYNENLFQRDWKVGDDASVELSYRRSSTYPYDVVRLMALMQPANFYNLAVDLDNYKYNQEFNQYLVNNRSHLRLNDIQVYGNGIAKTSYINWIVDYEKQIGLNATENITTMLNNMDVRLVYRLAGFSDKTMLKFFVEKGTPNSTDVSLLIPDESFSVLLYDNQPFNKIVYSSVVVQLVQVNGNFAYSVYGNSQTNAYFRTLKPKYSGQYQTFTVEDTTIRITPEHFDTEQLVPYGTIFYSITEVAQFISDYSAHLVAAGMKFETQENELIVDWDQMIAEFMYWTQTGWDVGSIVTLNPAAKTLKIEKDSNIVQPLTMQQTNFVLNQNLYIIQSKDLAIVREGVAFNIAALNEGDTISYGQFNVSNFEHGIVFDNVTIFNDVIYNLVTGLRQLRILLKGTKSAAWDGLVNASGFVYNQDNIQEWNRFTKYARGEIVTYKNKYWIAINLVQPSEVFRELDWKRTDYNEVQKGLLPNSSTRSFESTLYYDIEKANLEQDADLLGFSLIGFRPREYMTLADLSDITQVNVYRNLIKNKGTKNAVDAFKGANLPQGGIQYDVFENWSIKAGEFGGVLNNNFVEFKLNENNLTGNPAYVGLTNGQSNFGVQQEVPIYSLFNYGRPITDPNVLPTQPSTSVSDVFPSAGYVNFNDVKMSALYYSQMPIAVNKTGLLQPIDTFYVRDYAWVANYKQRWEVFTPYSFARVIYAQNNLNDTVTLVFDKPHNLTQYQPIAVVNFDTNINGYYIALIIVDANSIIINKTLDQSIAAITGEGIGLVLSSQRVNTPADISNLPLVNFEFTKNTVWVDTNTDGSWGVYRKNINYKFEQQFTKNSSQSLGNAVALISENSYLIADSDDAKVYRYSYNDVSQGYELVQTLSGTGNFGYAIAYAQDIFVIISESSNLCKIYQSQNTPISDDLIEVQSISVTAPESIAISGDKRWLYVGMPSDNTVKVYQQDQRNTKAGYFTIGQTYVITSIGSTDFMALGASGNYVGVIFVATGIGTGTGTATNITYNLVKTIDADTLGLTTTGDSFGLSVSTDYYGDCLVVGAPNKDFNTISNWGYSYAFNRTEQNVEVQTSNLYPNAQSYPLAWTPATTQKTASATNGSPNFTVTLNNTTGLNVNDAVVFTSTINGLADTNLYPNVVYYIHTVGASTIKLKTERDTTTVYEVTTNASFTATMHVQNESLFVSRNGTLVTDNNYAVVGSSLVYTGSLTAGDVVTISGSNVVLQQTLTTQESPQIGSQFGYSVDVNNSGNEILVGAPFQLNTQFEEGTVYRYTDGGSKYGQIIGTADCDVTTPGVILLNGYLVNIPVGNAETVANAISSARITNVIASAISGKLIISLVNPALAQTNNKLVLTAVSANMFTELGIIPFTKTQEILCPHKQGPTQFGKVVKFNDFDSVIISAPAGTRFAATTFDFIDDENQDNDTIFDNNATQWIDQTPNYGAVYIFDYLQQYNETLLNVGKFVYGQSVNSPNVINTAFNTFDQTNDITISNQPYYGTALDFNNHGVIVGTPNDTGATTGYEFAGSATTFRNLSGTKNWELFRYSGPVVDINRIYNIQLFSAETNNTLINLDYIDPLQGKILGVARENIDIISNTDPATYNNTVNLPGSLVWGEAQLGTIWLDTTNMRYVNYHQNDDVQYNGEYWGTLFPGSDVAVYSWVASNVVPSEYNGTGTPYQVDSYSTQFVVDNTGALAPIYYYWVRDTNTIFVDNNKTLADSIVASYIANPKGSGISYLSPVYPNVFGLYNSNEYFNANDTVLHIGFATGTNDDVSHEKVNLIRAGYPDDFLPGVPLDSAEPPLDLYDRLIDSLSGVDELGQVVPNPFLPKAVQLGVLARPRQSFFYNRYVGLQNYLQYANTIISQYAISEIRQNLSFLFEKNPVINETIFAGNCQEGTTYTIVTVGDVDWTSIGAPASEVGVTFVATGPATGEFRNTGTAVFVAFEEGQLYDTTNYWEYINWWSVGYSDATKSNFQVNQYADLSTLTPSIGTIATVATNNPARAEVYRYNEFNEWVLIGINNGTIRFKSSLWDYSTDKFGFGDNFFDTQPYDLYPSTETRNIIRAINEQIFTEDLLEFRNKSLILLFEYIQTETFENQNYLPWLNKTSFIDVSHTIRELRPIQVFQNDNQEFLAGYINEVKPYHVVIKEFIFKYTGNEFYAGNITDFDLPSKYNSQVQLFETPELVYSNPNGVNTFLPDDPIWSDPDYAMWYANTGLSVGIPITINGATSYVGEQDYEIATLATYLATNTTAFAVSNAQGFPLTGIIQINGEKIAYSSVDRALNVISGLTRGVDGTPIEAHIPGEIIYMDLPAVIVLDGGRGYTNPPRVSAQIDTTIYPAPIREAVFTPVMSLDSVLSITVDDPGEGYAVMPEIVIEPAIVIPFASTDVNALSSTIRLFAPLLETGDIVQYKVGENSTTIGGLKENAWYYVNVLETVPTVLVGLYTSAGDAQLDHNRVVIYNVGSGTGHTFNVGARATGITNSLPIRENTITLRFDRTTYNSTLTNWTPGEFYGSYYAGHFADSNKLASSALLLQSTRPPIETILASAHGVAFEITSVVNDNRVVWGTFIRTVTETSSIDNSITLLPYDNGYSNTNASGSTIGFYIGMPIKFEGPVLGQYAKTASATAAATDEITLNNVTNIQVNDPIVFTSTLGNLVVNQVYYVLSIDTGTSKITVSESLGGSIFALTNDSGSVSVQVGGLRWGVEYYVSGIISDTKFTVSTAYLGNTINLNTDSASPYLLCNTGDLTNIAVLTVIYPGIREVTATTAITNNITIPLNPTGTGGTSGFYIGLPLVFTGTKPNRPNNGVFGGIVENQPYFVTTIIDSQTFTMSSNANPVTFTVTSTDAGTDTVTIDGDTQQLSVNEPIIFNTMIVSGVESTTFGGLTSGVTYYISSITSGISFKVSTEINGDAIALSTVAAATDTSALLTSQKDTVTLTNADATLNENYGMVVNIDLPVSPGQVSGQLFTLEETSGQFPGLVGTNGSLIIRNVSALIGNKYTYDANELIEDVEYEILTVGSTDFTLLGAASNTVGVRFIANDSNTGTGSGTVTQVVNRLVMTNFIEGTAASLLLSNIYDNMPIEISETLGPSFLTTGTTYYVVDKGFVEITVTATLAAGFLLRCNDTSSLFVNMPIIFTGSSIGGVLIDTEFYIKEVVNETDFKITNIPGGVTYEVFSESGIMLGTGQPFIKLSTTVGGTDVNPGDTQQSASITAANPAVVTVSEAPVDGTRIEFRNGTVPTGMTLGVTYYVRNATSNTFNVSLLPAGPLVNTSLGTPTTSTMIIDEPVQIEQTPLSFAEFDISYILGGYRAVITDPGEGYAVDNKITIPGTLLGGTTPLNDAILTVNNTDSLGGITQVICAGTVPGEVNQYYLRVISSNQFEVYANKQMTIPVSGLSLPYTGTTSTIVTATTATTNIVTVSSTEGFEVNDAIVFTGNVAGGIELGKTYYILDNVDFTPTTLQISDEPNGTAITLTTTTSQSFSMAKVGSFAFLPEPVQFNQSIVKFNNRVYSCLVSNNDTEFVLGKWELLRSSDRRLNALDRVRGYYAPTDNMPGLDLTQLFEGISYPNSTYLGNAFAPDQQYPIDTILQDLPFYPTEVAIKSVTWNGITYLAAANMPDYSSILTSTTGNNWEILKLANVNINLTDIIYADGYYIITSNNTNTPIFRSENGINWTTAGMYTPYGDEPYDSTNFDTTSILSNNVSLNSVAHAKSVNASQLIPNKKYQITALGDTDWNVIVDTNNVVYKVGDIIQVTYAGYGTGTAKLFDGSWVAVGQHVLTSSDTYAWRESYTFTNEVYISELQGVDYINTSFFAGYIAVGRELEFNDEDPTTIYNLLLKSIDGETWDKVPFFSTKGLYAVTNNNNIAVAVGEDGAIYISEDGTLWTGVNRTLVTSTNSITEVLNVVGITGLTVGSTVRFNQSFNNIVFGTTYYVFEIISNTQLKISPNVGDTIATSITPGLVYQITSLGTTDWNVVAGTVAITYVVGDVITAASVGTGDGNARELVNFTTEGVPELTEMFVHPVTTTLYDIYFANSTFVAVGVDGLIRTSTNGISWTTRTSGVTEDLYGVYYNSDDGIWIVTGNNNTIVVSDDNGITWEESSLFENPVSTYTVQGDPFTFGYGPEELVPGIITDNVTLTVATRPGTNWSASEYAHVGYNVVSLELTPESGTQTAYSFANSQELGIQSPAQIAVYIIDGTTNLCTAIYDGNEFTVDWVNFVVNLNSPLPYLPVSDKLRIDVYEVGNGSQLVKANTKTDPIRYNESTGWNEIFVNCNYSGELYQGSGVVPPGSFPVEADATDTSATFNTITVTDIKKFSLNDSIEFQGSLFGGIEEDVIYFVKTINLISSTITISNSAPSGVAGPTYPLTDGTGLMKVIITRSAGDTYTPPIVYHNGSKLSLGVLATVTGTKSSNNSVVCNSTSGLSVNDKVTFSDSMFGPDLLPQTVYYIKTIIDTNEFTVSDTLGGSIITLTDAFGGSEFVSNDYAFGIQPNGVSAKIIFATGSYDASVDYLSYTLFGETTPDQLGYTVPETQIITGDGTVGPFALTNFIGQNNPENAIVEINGLRVIPSDYTIDFNNSDITFSGVTPGVGDVIAVTTYNFTQFQYLSTQYGIAGTDPGYDVVSEITFVDNVISPYLVVARVIATTATTNVITCAVSTTGFVENQTVKFTSTTTGLGGIQTDGTVYYVKQIVNGTQFTISATLGGPVFTLTTDSGAMDAYVGGQPAVRVTTSTAHGLSTNDVVRIDGVGGSVQLNNNTYYVHVINSTQVDLYNASYDSSFYPTNDPVVDVSAYEVGSGGYIWTSDSYTLVTTVVTDTTTDPINGNYLTVADTSILVAGTPIIFTGTVFGGIVADTTYYIRNIRNTTDFSISQTRGGDEFVVTTASGSMAMTQWEQFNVDRLWVTVDGYRVPSSKLRLNPNNQVSILAPIASGDEVVITSMVPSATPNEEIFFINVNAQNQGAVYRANTQTRTWLTQPLYNTDDTIYVYDVTRITDTVVQSVVAPAPVDNIYSIGLTSDKNILASVTVYNETTGQLIASSNYEVVIESLSPILKITAGAYITSGDSLTITSLEGNLIYINGEQIKFSSIDFANNSISGLQRGTNGTGEQVYYPEYSEVFGILSSNRMPNADYFETWNSFVYNTVDGDPLQISTTEPAIFLRGDVS